MAFGRQIRRWLSFLLVICCLCSCAAQPFPQLDPEPGAAPAPAGPAEMEARTVAYLPLDDRSVNTRRVQYLAESLQYDLHMPPRADYRTLLDGQPRTLGSSGNGHGNRAALLAWLQEQEAQGCNRYILSMDQLMSGGLTASRYLTLEDDAAFGFGEASGLYQNCLDFLKELASDGENQIYILDTVMRLCFTDAYGGCDMALYGALRQYSRLERPAPAALTPDALAARYPMTLTGPALDALPAETAALLQSAQLEGMPVLERFHGARLRKLRLTEAVTAALASCENVCFLVGMDDSGTENNIQTGDAAFVQACLTQMQGPSFLFDGADELGMCALARMYAVQTEGEAVPVSVEYVGGGADQILSAYDSRPLSDCIAAHAESMDAVLVPENEAQLCVLAFTAADARYAEDRRLLKARLRENFRNGIPTVLLDLSRGRTGSMEELLLEAGNMTLLLGFSGYNTVGNSVGIGLAMGLSRLRCLQNAPEADAAACASGHLRSLTTAFVKEFTYKGAVQAQIAAMAAEAGLYSGDFYAGDRQPDTGALERALETGMEAESAGLLAALKGGRVITALSPYQEGTAGTLSIRDCSFPWYRTFEIDFSVEIDPGQAALPTALGFAHKNQTWG